MRHTLFGALRPSSPAPRTAHVLTCSSRDPVRLLARGAGAAGTRGVEAGRRRPAAEAPRACLLSPKRLRAWARNWRRSLGREKAASPPPPRLRNAVRQRPSRPPDPGPSAPSAPARLQNSRTLRSGAAQLRPPAPSAAEIRLTQTGKPGARSPATTVSRGGGNPGVSPSRRVFANSGSLGSTSGARPAPPRSCQSTLFGLLEPADLRPRRPLDLDGRHPQPRPSLETRVAGDRRPGSMTTGALGWLFANFWLARSSS